MAESLVEFVRVGHRAGPVVWSNQFTVRHHLHHPGYVVRPDRSQLNAAGYGFDELAADVGRLRTSLGHGWPGCGRRGPLFAVAVEARQSGEATVEAMSPRGSKDRPKSSRWVLDVDQAQAALPAPVSGQGAGRWRSCCEWQWRSRLGSWLGRVAPGERSDRPGRTVRRWAWSLKLGQLIDSLPILAAVEFSIVSEGDTELLFG